MTQPPSLSAFSLTPAAAARIKALAAQQNAAGLRVSVLGGGCSGFQYEFELVSHANPEDLNVERDGAQVLIDPDSLDLLLGGELDFVDDLSGSYFKISNPNATSRCGCGNSFSA